jgi:hypothetical protein
MSRRFAGLLVLSACALSGLTTGGLANSQVGFDETSIEPADALHAIAQSASQRRRDAWTREALSVLKETRAGIRVRFRPASWRRPVQNFALESTIHVENPLLLNVSSEIQFDRSAEANSIRAKSGIVLPEFRRDELASALLDEPDYVVCGSDRPGPAIWYVNGILTRKSSAITAGEEISKRLGHKVHVIFNPTVFESPHVSGLNIAGLPMGDLTEATYDRVWPAVAVGRLIARPFLKQQLLAEELQGNPTTRQLAWVLCHSEEPVVLVTHSQGCLIARNAFVTAKLMGRGDWMHENVTWIAAGIPLNDRELGSSPRQITVLDHRHDPIPKLLGLRDVVPPYRFADHDFMLNYVDQLTESMLHPE